MNKFFKGQRVMVNNPLSYKRKNEEARVKWTPSGDYYVTVRFDDGCCGKYKQEYVSIVN